MKAAVFLDRDGTIIDDVGHLGDPDGVRLLRGSAEAIRRFRRAGFRVVLVSNQSGIARGRFDEAALRRVHQRLEELLAAEGAVLDGAYYCPFLSGPEARVEVYRGESELRKPAPGMLLKAAVELSLDLSRSWMIGNSPGDIVAGRRAGCRTVLIAPDGRGDSSAARRSPTDPPDAAAVGVSVDEEPDAVAADLLEAADIIEHDPPGPAVSNRESASDARNDTVVALLHKIHDQLDQLRRDDRQQDFSVLRLFGALLQMFAIVTALAGLAGLIAERTDAATARFTLACFLQLAAICAFAVDRFR